MKRALALGLLAVSCVPASSAVRGRAQVVTWHGERVVAMCDSGKRYQLGVSTSNAAGQEIEVDRWLEKDEGPVIVELSGFEATLPSGWRPAKDVDGVLSVGAMRPVARAACR